MAWPSCKHPFTSPQYARHSPDPARSHKYGPNFRIKLAGQRFIFISAPDALDVFFRNRANNLVVGMIHSIAPAQIGGVHNAAAVHVVDAVLIPVIIKGNTDPALATFVPAFNAEMAAYLAHTHLAARARGVGVEHLATHGLFTCMWLAMFGPRFPVEIYADFLTIDKATHTLLNSLPVFGSAVPTARERMRAALNTYLQPWRDTNGEEDIDGVSCHGNDVMRALVTSGLTEFEQAGLLLTYVWGSSTNLTRVSAWLLAHLLADRAAYARLQAEIDAGCAAEYASTEALLRAHPRTVNGPSFPLLDSALKEVSRLHLLPMSHRLVADAVEFPAAGGGGATFAAAKGDHVMANITGIHWNETKFADPRVFQLDRFTAGDGVRYLYIWGRGAQIVSAFLLCS